MRPILLTAAAATLALIPIAREIFWGPMAYAMMGGIIAGTLLTLLFLPALYVAWFRIKEPIQASAESESSRALAIRANLLPSCTTLRLAKDFQERDQGLLQPQLLDSGEPTDLEPVDFGEPAQSRAAITDFCVRPQITRSDKPSSTQLRGSITNSPRIV